jgi:putative ABC transport system permease protein
VDTFLHDLKYAVRSLRRSAAIGGVVITIAFTVGIGSTVFSVIRAVVLQPLPYRDPGRLVLTSRTYSRGEGTHVSYAEFQDWRYRRSLFEDLAAVHVRDYALLVDQTAHRVSVHVVSSNWFSLFGVNPVLGRSFVSYDDQAGRPAVALLSESAWKGMFGADPRVIGRRIRLTGRRDAPVDYEIVGVIPTEARLHWLPPPSLFIPDVVGPETWDPGQVREVIGRLKTNVTISQAATELTQLASYGGPYSQVGVTGSVTPLHDAEFGNARRGLTVLATSMVFVLIMACANIAALLLAVGGTRRRELAARASLGATRGQLLRLLLTEEMLLTALGGIAGVFVTSAGIRIVVALSPRAIPRIETVAVDVTAVALTLRPSFSRNLILLQFSRQPQARWHRAIAVGERSCFLHSWGLFWQS